tara:strand:- start:1442 stop:2533 length:1092 start_codon:yes stop_codon:yes gene_type:complete
MTIFIKIFFNTLLKIQTYVFLTILIAHSSFAIEVGYVVKNITINESAESASQAREIANVNANREAFLRLLKKLSVNESFSDYIEDEQIEEAVHSKNISNEKIADDWYKATFDIEFNRDYIDSLLESKDSGIELSKKYLVFPLETKDQKLQIWHDNNKWFNAWREVLLEKESKDIKIPKGDISDISILESIDLKTIKYPDIKDIIKKYDSKIAVFIDIYLDHIENNAAINITIVRKFTKKKVKLSFVDINDIKEDRLYHIIAQKIIEYLNKKDLSEIDRQYQKENDDNISIDILPSSLKSWVAFEKKLKSIKDIKFKVLSISTDLIKLSVEPKDGVDISKYLENYGIFVEKNTEDKDTYYISLY